MINVSQNAQKHLLLLLSKEPIGTQIRAFIEHPGTCRAKCGIAYCSAEDITELDHKLKYNKFYIYVEQSIYMYFKNSEIDLVVDNLSTQLTFKAPYSTNNLLNHSYSLTDQIKYFLKTEINSQLSLHGGQVNLVTIHNHNIAVIKFSGGCNGCSMSQFTLKEMIEKKILFAFPKIKKVHDITNHIHGEHSFY